MKRSLLSLALLTGLAACGSDADQPAGEAPGKALPAAESLRLDAGGLPRFRAGLWEINSRRGAETETRRICQAVGVEPELRKFLAGPAGPGCQKSRSNVGGGLRVAMQCVGPGSQMEVTIALAGSETRYTMTMDTAVTGADGSRADESTTADARWISACPAGMEPGEAVEE